MNQHQCFVATQLCTAHSLIPSISYKNVRCSHLCIILLPGITSLHHFLTHCLILSCLNLIFSKGQKQLFHHAHHFNSFHLFALQTLSLKFLRDIKAFYYLSSINFYLAVPRTSSGTLGPLL
jgi:hypothetical protein